jgi:hypothetical protein
VLSTGLKSVGEFRTGLLEKTREPDPVSSVTAKDSVADVGFVKNGSTLGARPLNLTTGKLVQFDKLPDWGVPSAGLIKTGELLKTSNPVPVVPVGLTVEPSIVKVPLIVALLNVALPVKFEVPATARFPVREILPIIVGLVVDPFVR